MYYPPVITRLYVHNFRCLENFELPISGKSSALLIGNNGSGKTTVGLALRVLQKIARGRNRVEGLVKPKDLFRGRTDVPVRFEIEVELNARIYGYTIAFEFPAIFRELCVLEEKLTVGGESGLHPKEGASSFSRQRYGEGSLFFYRPAPGGSPDYSTTVGE